MARFCAQVLMVELALPTALLVKPFSVAIALSVSEVLTVTLPRFASAVPAAPQRLARHSVKRYSPSALRCSQQT